MTLNIRQFDESRDLSVVLDLWRRSRPGIQLSPSDEPDEIRKKLQRDPDLFLVGEEDSIIIGAVLGGFDGRRGIVYHLAVDPARRRQGVGWALMHELEKRLRRKGCLRYYLLVAKDNHEAMDFYQMMDCELMELYVLGKVIQ